MDFPGFEPEQGSSAIRHGRLRVLVKFLGLLGPQGALPLATTEEAYSWS